MFPYNLLILPLVGGYFILANFAYFKHKYQRLDTARLLLNSILIGILVGMASFTLRAYIEIYHKPLFDELNNLINYLPFKRDEHNRYIGTLTYGLILAVSLTLIANFIIHLFGLYTHSISWAVSKHGDELEQLFRDSAIKGQLVQLTLKNEKVYLGIVDKIPEPKKSNYITIIPFYSGYRNKDTKEMELTTSYAPINDLIDKKEINPKVKKLMVVIKQDEIISAHPHDPEIYSSFVNAKKARAAT